MERLFGKFTFVLLLYFVLTIAMTFPLAAHFRTAVPAGAVDLWQNYWNFWWWEKCLIDLHQSPYHTQYLFHPTGATMIFYTHSPLNMILALPVSIAFGYAAAYNFTLFVALTLSGATMYLLVRELTQNPFAAFLSGLIFAFFPQHLEQTTEHLNLFSTQFMPLSVFFLIRLCRRGGLGNTVGFGAAFACNALVSWHLGILLCLTLVPIALFEGFRSQRARRHILRDIALAALISTLLALPAAWPLFGGLASGESYFQKPPTNKGIDPLFLLLPSDRHPILGALTEKLYSQRQAYFTAGFLCYLGLTPLVLAGWSLARPRRGIFLWFGLFIGSLTFALGARLIVGGNALAEPPLPFALLAHFPVLRLMRVANRFATIASLALAVMAGIGFAAVRLRPAVKFIPLAFLILFEYLWLPYPIQRIEHPAFYEQLMKAGEQSAVLHIPFTTSPDTVHNMLAQTAHGRPIAGGYLSTTPPEAKRFIDEDPVLAYLSGLKPRIRRRIDTTHLRSLGFGYAIVHKDPRSYARSTTASGRFRGRRLKFDRPGLDYRQFRLMRRAFEAAAGKPVFEDETIVVFDLGEEP